MNLENITLTANKQKQKATYCVKCHIVYEMSKLGKSI
jgi:hypothetical protein